MDRRAFLFSALGLSVAPAPTARLVGLQGGAPIADSPPPPAGDLAFAAWREGFVAKAVAKGLP